MKLIDSHAHLMDEMYENDLEAVIRRCEENNIECVVNIGYSEKTSYEAIKMSEKYDWMYATIGLHPDECNQENVDMEFIYQFAKNQKVVAIGEIGLDYHYESTNRENQKRHFIKQIEIANELNLPVVIHSRDADMDMLKILKENKIKNNFVMHCFSSSAEIAKEIIKLGGYISFSGTVTFKNARNLVEIATNVPEDKFLIETDCPYLTPEPNRGKRNEPLYVWQTAEKIAKLRNITMERISEITIQNTKRFYML